MATLNELDTSPEEAARGEIPVDAAHLGPATSEEITVAVSDNGQNADVADADQNFDLPFPAPRRRNKIRQAARRVLRPLLAAATSQYVLVAALAGLTAYAVASNASKFVNTTFESIIVAFKRL